LTLIVSNRRASGFRITLSRIWRNYRLHLAFFVPFVPTFVFFVIRFSRVTNYS